MFPNQTIPVLPADHWAVSSGEIWVPVDQEEPQAKWIILYEFPTESAFYLYDIIHNDLKISYKQVIKLIKSYVSDENQI